MRSHIRFWVGFVLMMAFIASAFAHDDGSHANSPLKSWFDGLRSELGGPCCSQTDGFTVDDPDWESKDGHYRVRIPDTRIPGDPMVWVDVKDEAVIKEPNRAGPTMVWPVYGIQDIWIRCFLPGSMT